MVIDEKKLEDTIDSIVHCELVFQPALNEAFNFYAIDALKQSLTQIITKALIEYEKLRNSQ